MGLRGAAGALMIREMRLRLTRPIVAVTSTAPEAEALERDGPELIEESVNGEQRYVLNELIIALMRKRVLSDAEGKAMLQKLLH